MTTLKRRTGDSYTIVDFLPPAVATLTAKGWRFAGNVERNGVWEPSRLCMTQDTETFTWDPPSTFRSGAPGWCDIPNGDTILALYPGPNDTVFIKCQFSEWLLYGQGWDTFELVNAASLHREN